MENFLKEEVFWPTTLPPNPTRWSQIELPTSRQDMIIAGGGITGLSAALSLARQGLSVAVLESHTIGCGASSRNGGQVLTGLKQPVSFLIKKFGLSRAHEIYQASLDSIDCVGKVIEEEKIECDYVRTGHLYAAAKLKHWDDMRRTQELLSSQWGYHTRLIFRDEIRSELNTDYYCGGLVDGRSGGINPAQYVRGLALAAERTGAVLLENCPALTVCRENGVFYVKTPKGTLKTSHFLVATNSYTSSLFPYLQKRIVPVGSYIIATEPLSSALAQNLIPHRRMVFDSRYFLYYFRLSSDNRMIFGGRTAFYPVTSKAVQKSAEILQRGMVQVFPQLSQIKVDYAWGGLVDVTLDFFPHTGEINGIYYAVGYCGHGIAMATYLGQKIAERVMGIGGEHPFENLPFPSIPFYHGNPWFLPLGAIWYRFLDLIR